MSRSYLVWAMIGMVGYSCTPLFLKLTLAGGRVSAFLVLTLCGLIVFPTAATITYARGGLSALSNITGQDLLLTAATGISLAVAVNSLFLALTTGPASVVVPVYGMFIVGGAVLGILFLHEPLTLRKALGILCAALSIYLIAANPR
jgi:transporter family protein